MRTFRAPGRVNLIGEHTDYNGGFVLPMAIDRATTVRIAPRQDDALHITSFGETVVLEELVRRDHWSDYIAGVAWGLRSEGAPLGGADLFVESDVPVGAGLSSSAAVEVASGLAFLALAGRELPGPELAVLCQRAENEFVGMRCGVMDQFISRCAEADHALLLDCQDLSYRQVPIKGAVVIANSMVKHALASGEYNVRRAECEEGCRRLGIASLREAVSLDGLEGAVLARCRHVVSENARVLAAGEALTAGDLPRFGRLMHESHLSMRDDFAITCPEIDRLVELATGFPGVYGARMTGGGFGGCTVNLVEPSAVEAFCAHLRQGYPPVEIYTCRASRGGHEVNS